MSQAGFVGTTFVVRFFGTTAAPAPDRSKGRGLAAPLITAVQQGARP